MAASEHRDRRRAEAERDQGFVLVVVLLALAVLGGAAATFAASLRMHVRETASAVARAQAESLAEAGVSLALLDVLTARGDRRHPRRFKVNGPAVACLTGDHVVEISISDETSRVDINTAGEDVLAALFRGAGAAMPEARRMAQSLLDYRDPDDIARPFGAEVADYRAAGLPHGPRNGPFPVVEEMARVRAMDPRVIERVAPFLTVHSGHNGLDPEGASIDVLQMILAGHREAMPVPSEAGELRAAFRRHLPQLVAVPGGQRFLLRATARGAATFTREAVVEMVSSRTRTHAVRAWRQISSRPPLPAASVDIPPC